MAGQPKAIESPEKFGEYFKQYQVWVKENPYLVHSFVGKDANEVDVKKQRPLTWKGFEAWLYREEICYHLGHYEQNTDNHYTAYLPIIRACKAQCSADIIDGALAQVYNANIAARVEGLKEQTDVHLNDARKDVANLFPLDEAGETK